MAEQNAVATQQGTQLSVAAQVKSMISQDAVKIYGSLRAESTAVFGIHYERGGWISTVKEMPGNNDHECGVCSSNLRFAD